MRLNSLMRAILCLVVAICAAACNLTRDPPTPTPVNTLTPGPTLRSGPTPIPSITPLNFQASATPAGVNANCPPPPADFIAYVVVEGDTVNDLAQGSGTTPDEIVRVNCLTDANSLTAGTTIYLRTSPVSG